MKKKIVIALILTCILLTSIGIGFFLYKINDIETEPESVEKLSSELVTDDCTKERRVVCIRAK